MQLSVSAAAAIYNQQGEAKIAGSASHIAEPAKPWSPWRVDLQGQATVTRYAHKGRVSSRSVKGKHPNNRQGPAQATCHPGRGIMVTLLCASVSLSGKWGTGHSGEQGLEGPAQDRHSK